mgnify:CR=1 FL=1|jgi:hypothetical protein
MIKQTRQMKADFGTRGRDISLICASIFGVAVFLSSSAPLQASELALGNYGAVAVDVQSSLTHSSNIFRNSDEEEDTIFQLLPRLRYRFDQGTVRVEAHAGVNVIRFDDFDDNDAEDIKSRVVIDFPYGDYDEKKRYDVRLAGGYNERTSPNDSVQDITQTEEIDLSAIGRYYVSDRTFLRSGVEYLDKQSQSSGYDDVERIEVPVEFYYDYSEDLSYGIGYRYTDTDVSSDTTEPEADSTDHAVYLAAVGQVAPSVTVEIRVGGQERQFDDASYDDETQFFMESLLSWVASDLTTVELSAGNGFDTTIDDVSKETFFVEVGVEHQFSDKIRALAGLGYEDVKYSNDRDDDQYTVDIGSVYTLITDQLEIEGGLRYADRDSSEDRSTYDVLSAKISISYLF